MNASHVSICAALWILRISQEGSNVFFISRKKVMQPAAIRSSSTYHKNIRELQQWRLISYTPSYHPSNGSTITLKVQHLIAMPATIIIPEDLQSFKKELLEDIRKLLSEQKTVRKRKWLKSGEVRKLLALSHGTLLQMRVNGLLPLYKNWWRHLLRIRRYQEDDRQAQAEYFHLSIKKIFNRLVVLILLRHLRMEDIQYDAFKICPYNFYSFVFCECKFRATRTRDMELHDASH